MMKKIMALLCALLMLAALAGCGAKATDENNPAESAATLSVEEAKAVMSGLMKDATTVWFYHTCGGCPSDMDSPAPGKEGYFLVDSPDFNTLATLKAYTEQFFTPECAQRSFYAFIGDDVEYSRFLEIDGKLYAFSGGKGWPYEYNLDSLAIVSQTADTLTVSVDRMCFEQTEGKSVFVFKNTDGKWRFDNNFSESAAEDYLKLIG